MNRVYIAGPYSGGDVCQNIAKALEAATKLLDLGWHPYVPHLTHFWHLQHLRPVVVWMNLDREWLCQCHCVLRLPGASVGAENEVDHAQLLGIPVYDDIDALLQDGPVATDDLPEPLTNKIESQTRTEREGAERRYGPFTSAHEGYGVLCEEVLLELLGAIRDNNPEAVFTEAIQVAAVAQRIAECVTVPASRKRSGMGET